MFLVIACEVSVRRSQILPIDKILEMATHECFCFFGCHVAQAYPQRKRAVQCRQNIN